jgi:hypothetical protein
MFRSSEPLAPEREADAEFAVRCSTEYAINPYSPDGCEQHRHEREDAEQQRIELDGRGGLRDHLLHRAEVRDRQIGDVLNARWIGAESENGATFVRTPRTAA